MAETGGGEVTVSTGDFLRGRLISASKRGDIMLPLGVVAILVVLILPMPKWMLDFALALSITISVLILMTALLVERPLDFNAFPTILLLATMIRLSLNLASTRLILSDGHQGTAAAGKVIEAFGEFVIAGNYLFGFIIFAILMIINFIVVTKGAGRVSEVIARFTLDGLPGKQMAIDADLNAGLITEEEARTRRSNISREADFYGAMDGASKFVRGDAIAGILITLVNILGGLGIGVLQRGMITRFPVDNHSDIVLMNRSENENITGLFFDKIVIYQSDKKICCA